MTQFNVDEQRILSKNIKKISYQLHKEINIRGIHSLIHFKDNYFIGLVNQYANPEKNPIEKNNSEENQLKNLIIYEINFT